MRTALLTIAPPLRIETIHASFGTDRPSATDRAIEDCIAAWTEAHRAAKENGQPAARSLRMACVAYKMAMPRLTNITQIRAAIACIAHGITLEVFDGRDGSQLLYAAQVALSLHRARKAKK